MFDSLRQLPEDLTQLDEDAVRKTTGDLLEANRTLESLHRALTNYTPRYVLNLNPTPGEPRGEIVEGTFIFADMTGFTALTELLAKYGGGRGEEVVNEIINRLFGSILDPLAMSGGDSLIFPGDAVLAYFPRQDNHGDVLQAIRAALRMQRAVAPFATLQTEFGPCSLTMSVGVDCGRAYAGVVGNSRRMGMLVSGPATVGTLKAQDLAQTKQIWLGDAALKIAAPHFTMDGPVVVDDLGDALGDYEILPPTRKQGIAALFDKSLPSVLRALEDALKNVERLAPFMAADKLARLVNTKRHRQLEPQFRPVAAQFINLSGLEGLAETRGVAETTAVFQRYFTRVQEILDAHEGAISQINNYTNGFFLVNTFGSPKVHEGTTRYAVSSALQLSQALKQINQEFKLEPPLQQRGGITHGLVFTTEVGSKYRRGEVLIGPAVNRSARLMSKAGSDQVILDPDIWEKTQSAFVGERLPAVQLKGIEGKVVIVNVRELRFGSRLSPPSRPPLEREAAQAQLSVAVEQLCRTRQGSAWMVSSETGLGKTTFVAAMAEQARQQGATVAVGRCQPHGRHIPFYVWADVLTSWLDFDADADLEHLTARLAHELDDLGMAAHTKTFANWLGLPVEGQSSEAQAEAESQAHQPQLMTTLIQKLAAREHLIIILEDAHWLDQDSLSLLHDLLGTLPGLLLIVTGREPLSYAGFTPLPLAPLSPAALIEVAQRTLAATALNKTLADWICRQASGNPLYVEELCRKLLSSEAVLVDKDTGLARWTGTIPTLPLSLRELLLARLDQLPLSQLELLKCGAILGTQFEYEPLLVLLREQLTAAEIHAALEETIGAAFLAAIDEDTYYFTHPLMQEVIYTTLSFAQRQARHTQIGDWLVNQNRWQQALELIAYHYLRGADMEKAVRFGLWAGDKARERRAYAGALSFYNQVLELQGIYEEDKKEAAEGKGDVLALQEHYDEAREAYTPAVKLGSASALSKQAILAGTMEALAETEFTPELRPWADGSRAWLLAQQGEPEAALELAQATLRSAEGAVRSVLARLIQALQAGGELGPYKVWLRHFAAIVMHVGFSPVDLIGMSPTLTTIVKKIIRQNGLSLAAIAEQMDQSPEQIQKDLNQLVKQGHIRQVKIKDEIWYKPRFGRKSEKRLSTAVWEALQRSE
jgi:class 3 adenylate cyclase/tetratricopeptide (TPR) repeat protein